jgi:ribonuclease HI
MQLIEESVFMKCENHISLFFHIIMHSDAETASDQQTRVTANQLSILTTQGWVTHVGCRGQNGMSDVVAYVDGGSLGNPGPSGIGVVLDSEGRTIRIAKWIGRQDNNVAEYIAVLEALQCALALKARKLHIYSDSEVVVRQMRGEYICRSPRLYSLNWICRKLARSFDFTISHVRREHNTEANRLANSAVRKHIP